jgi:hypothetical protein
MLLAFRIPSSILVDIIPVKQKNSPINPEVIGNAIFAKEK